MLQAYRPHVQPPLLVLDNREAILDLAPLLQSLAERCGQPGAMHWLPYFLDKAAGSRRAPFLVLLLRPEEDQGRSLTADGVEAAALFFEYRLFGLRTGAVATADAVGFNSVIAPSRERTRVAAVAARALVERGASVVLATYEGYKDTQPRGIFADFSGVSLAARQRQVERTLRLKPTLDATLAQMGKSTRFNLRYYRRRLEKIMAIEYVPGAAAALVGADLQAINASALNPVTAAEFGRRVRSASELPGSFLCGLRSLDGRWLSLIGGWRQGSITVLHWQMNAAGLEKHSIGTVMRSFFLESEIGRGAEQLLIYGGTPHTMRHAFEQQPIADLVVRRHGPQAALLCAASRFLATPKGLLGRSNFLASTLQDATLDWVTEAPAGKPQHRALVAPQRTETAA